VRRLAAWAAAFILGATIITACQERLTSPAECPALCPGGAPRVFDTIVTAAAGRDSSFPTAAEAASGGYVGRGGGSALLLSSGYVASEDRAIYRFVPRSDQIAVRDTFRTYTIDSALINITILARDTLVNGLKLYLYRLPSTIDSTATFADVDPLLSPTNLIDSIAVPDSVNTGTVGAPLNGAELSQIALAGADSTLVIGLRMTAEVGTGIRVGSLASGTAATFTTFVTVDVPDTGSVRKQSLSRATAFNTFVTQNPIVPVDSLLTVGSEPSNRALIRFGLTNGFLDSATVVRATLELTPVQPIIGLPNDPSALQALAVVGDIGAKSPITGDATFIKLDTLPTVQSDTVRVDVTRIMQLWQTSRDRPQSIFLRMLPEAATFARAVFYSTRSHGPDPSALVAPRLRITYQRTFPFENP
jgi:hypothetical protein